MKVFKCTKCGNMISYLNKDACDVKCCGEAMVELVPNTTDAAGEKHVPVIEIDGNTVTVKDQLHILCLRSTQFSGLFSRQSREDSVRHLSRVMSLLRFLQLLMATRLLKRMSTAISTDCGRLRLKGVS